MNAALTTVDRTAGNLLREARSRRHMSQRDLAVAAGVPQSMVARIETGSRQPSIPTLKRLLDATGFVIKPNLSNAIRPSQLLVKYRDQLSDLAREYGITRVRVFGSVVRGEDRSDSDLDLLVDLDPSVGSLKHLGFAEAAEQILGCRVDVVTSQSLHKLIRDAVLREAQELEQV